MIRTDPAWVRERLRYAGVRSNHEFGQHFLIDHTVLDDIAVAADLTEGETVVEIGPGLGVLTERLLSEGVSVQAFELDPVMASVIRTDFHRHIEEGCLSVREGDVLKTLPEYLLETNEPYSIVSNIPYQITTPLIQLLWQDGRLEGRRPRRATLLVQKEVAERLAAPARASDRSFLSFVVQYYADVSMLRTVPDTSFWPAPKVQSAVVTMSYRADRPLAHDGEAEHQLMRFVRSSFLQRRKQLKNVLAGMRSIPVAEVERLFLRLGLPATARAQELTEEQWLSLAASIG